MKISNGKRIWRVNDLAVSPDGQEIAIGTSEGAYILSLTGSSGFTGTGLPVSLQSFNPTALTEEVNQASVDDALTRHDWLKATILALSLNELEVFTCVFNEIPIEKIGTVVSQIPKSLFLSLVMHLAHLLHPIDGSSSVERSMTWVTQFIRLQFNALQEIVHQTLGGREIRSGLCGILQHVQSNGNALGNLMRDNAFMLAFLSGEEEEEEDVEEKSEVRIEDLVV